MKKLRLLWTIFKRTHADKLILSFIISFFVCATIIFFTEPHITNYADALWFTFATIFTIGYGDVTVSTHIARIVSVYITLHAVLILAVIPGIVTSYYLDVVKAQQQDTATTFLDKLQRLPELSKEELETLSNNVKKYVKKK